MSEHINTLIYTYMNINFFCCCVYLITIIMYVYNIGKVLEEHQYICLYTYTYTCTCTHKYMYSKIHINMYI
jgi:hypothetical protein